MKIILSKVRSELKMPLHPKLNKIRFSGYYHRFAVRFWIFLIVGFFVGMAYDLSHLEAHFEEKQQEQLTEEIKLFNYAQNHTFAEYYATKYEKTSKS